jgi:hypothetical protein
VLSARLLVILIYVAGWGAFIAAAWTLRAYIPIWSEKFGFSIVAGSALVVIAVLVGLGYLIDRPGPKERR